MNNKQDSKTSEGNALRAIATGDKVRLTVDVERYPHFIARKGMTGIVLDTHTSDYPSAIAVKLDQHLDGCEEWDNTLLWQDEEREYFLKQVEKI